MRTIEWTDLGVDPSRLEVVAPGWARLSTVLYRADDGALLADLRIVGAESVEAEILQPFSWDAGRRGVITRRCQVDAEHPLRQIAGPYATADAAAENAGADWEFPVLPADESHRYLKHGVEPGPEATTQDTAGWCVLALPSGQSLVLAWDHSGTVLADIGMVASDLRLRLVLPRPAFDPEPDSPVWGTTGPDLHLLLVPGGIDAGVTALRTLITDHVVPEPPAIPSATNVVFPYLVANSWGVQENTTAESIIAMMGEMARLGAEVFVHDKGWERKVGDWHTDDQTYPGGLAALADEAAARGMGFGIWCAFGNADPDAPVLAEHPDWVATWRGQAPTMSFGNHVLCLGHDPARDWALAELSRMVTEFKLSWWLHDFETIARCDNSAHTHGSGLGEYASARAARHVLSTLRDRFPDVVFENCWNGGRPLDLQMIGTHHTTITEDHTLNRWNLLAKNAMGRYLPLDWQSAYMGSEPLPPRARAAAYAVGGPWVIMEDPTRWDETTREMIGRAASVYKAWRSKVRRGVVSLPRTDPEAGAVQATCADGSALLAVTVPEGASSLTVTPALPSGAYALVDEWTGESREVRLDGNGLALGVDPTGDGLLFSLTPSRHIRER